MAATSQPISPFSHKQFLEDHIREKNEQNKWLGRLCDTYFKKIVNDRSISRFEDFPFECTFKKRDVKIKSSTRPIEMLTGDHPLGNHRTPTFVIAIPCHKTSIPFLKGMIRKIEDELYGVTPNESHERVGNFVSIVIGVNSFYRSFDKAPTHRFGREIAELRARCETKPLSRFVSVSIIPFVWWHSWIQTSDSPKSSQFTMSKCYMIANSYFKNHIRSHGDLFNPEENLWFSKALTKTGGPVRDAVPYQKIRDTILYSSSFIRELNRSRSRLSYVLSLDCDFASLKSSSSQKGLLTHYEEQIEQFRKKTNHYPDVISSGYEPPASEESALIKEGLKLDRMIRSSLKGKFVYMPEPNMAFRVQYANYLEFNPIYSWQSTDSTMHTESRRLISNGLKKGVFNSNKFLFVKEGAIQTEIDEDWRTRTTERFKNLIPIAYTLPEIQKGLRHIHQSYAKPQVWATNIYQGMGVSMTGHMTHAITPLKQLREIYDPISLQNELPKHLFRNSILLEETISIYLIYNDLLNYYANSDMTFEEALEYFFERMNRGLIRPEWSNAITTQLQKLKQALTVLRANYDERQMTEILGAASNTGWSIAEFYYESLGLKSGFYA